MTRPIEMQSGFADVRGGRLYYESNGLGETIVLVHGNAGDNRHWDFQFAALADDYRVIRYDVRGFGKSSLPVEGEPYSDYEDLAMLLDQLDVRTAHVVGWSMGSGIVVDFALAYPGRTTSLISVGPWVFGYSSPTEQAMMMDMFKVGAALAGGGLGAAVDAWMKLPHFAAAIIDPAVGEQYRQIADCYTFWAFSHLSPQRMLDPSAAGRTSEIKAPTLILTAEHDTPACLEIADLLDESISDSRKIIMEGTGHLLHMEKPEEFNQHLIDFVDTVGRDGVEQGNQRRHF